MRPRLLDLCCGAGGAAVGYARAGFDVVGVDVAPQPRYPFNFVRGSCLSDWPTVLGPFDAVHASPPCQRWANGTGWRAYEAPDLIAPLRPLLRRWGVPYVIENVPAAPLRCDLLLCGTMFGLEADGWEVRRHRAFELGFSLGSAVPPVCAHRLPAMPIFGHNPPRDTYRRYHRGISVGSKRRAMGVPWMLRDELREAIPPAFTEWIGRALIAQLRARAAA